MKVYQISTLQALALGYTKTVITVEDLLQHGNTGLGTFEDVNGEMILLDGECFRAVEDGSVRRADPAQGVPFAAVAQTKATSGFAVEGVENMAELKELLMLKVEEGFGLNSMHFVRVDGVFPRICARSESPYHSQHVELKTILSETQKDFVFENISGTLVGIYYPDYMDGINAPGWHLHFLSEDRSKGGHVFDLTIAQGTVFLDRLNRIEIQLPDDPSFDTYALKEASDRDIREVEQGTGGTQEG